MIRSRSLLNEKRKKSVNLTTMQALGCVLGEQREFCGAPKMVLFVHAEDPSWHPVIRQCNDIK